MQGPTDVKEEVSVLRRLILNLVLFEGVLPTGCPDGRPHQRLRRGHQAASCALLRFICHMDRKQEILRIILECYQNIYYSYLI